MITISPSQIEAFAPEYGGCERKWAFDKIDRIPRKPNKYAQAGTELHTVAEQWLRDGIAPPSTPIGDAFRGGMSHLPLPRTVEVEVEARFERHDVHYFEKLDAFRTTRQHVDWPSVFVALVLDHKSTGDLAWADEKHAALLEHRDPQWLMYGAWAAQEHGADLVQGEWIYYLRRKPYSSRKLTVSATATELLEHFDEKIHPVSIRILQAREEPSSERPKNLQACGRYGGCPYREHCLASVSPLKRIAAMSDLSTARERLAARARNANPQPATESALQRKLRERREALEAQQREQAAENTPSEWGLPKAGNPDIAEPAPKEEPPAQVVEQQPPNDPPFAPRSSLIPTQVMEQQMRDEPEDKCYCEPPQYVLDLPVIEDLGRHVRTCVACGWVKDVGPAPEQVAEPSGQPPAEPAPEKPKRRGRPRGSKNKKAPTDKPADAEKVERVETTIAPPKNLADADEKARLWAADVAAAARAKEDSGKLDVLVRLHVAAIAAHQPPELANAHYRSILEQIEGER